MTPVTDTDIKELKELISKLSQSQTERFEAVTKDLTDLKVSVGKIEATLQTSQSLIQKVPDLAEKVGELKNSKQLLIIGVTSLISGLIGWLIRGGRL